MALPRKNKTNIGVIGLGIIGTRVASGLRKTGFQSFVWNRTPRPVPNFLGSPAEVAEMCDVIQLFVADGEAVLEMIDAMRPALTSQHIIVSNATIGLDATLEAAKKARLLGCAFLDAPFTGSKGAAEKQQLVYYVGGDEQVFLRAKPALEASSKAILRVGEIGQAAVIKVVTNLISATTAQTLAEALAIVKRAGIQPDALVQAIELNAMRSGVTDLKLPKMIDGDFEPHFSVKHMAKDVNLGLALARSFGLEVPATRCVGGTLGAAIANGWGDLDYAALAKPYESGTSTTALKDSPAS
jgi:3-hydroxyisobutyrate dehydrogenase-like beta-hydroxyacid dehydrogenase